MNLFEKILLTIALIIFGIVFVFIPICSYAGGVTDNNNGQLGWILVSTGQNNGANSIGEWTPPDFLKGDKGDTGEQGIQGIQGVQGLQGIQGTSGINGVDGKDGLKGEKGDKGDTGRDGLDGKTGATGSKGDIGDKGATGEQGIKGADVDPSTVNNINNTNSNQDNKLQDLDNRLGKLEEVQYVIEPELRLFDSKKWQLRPFIRYNGTRNMVDVVGVRVTFKIGESYEEKQIKKIDARLASLEAILKRPEVQTAIEKEQMKNVKVGTDGRNFWLEKTF